MADVQYYTAPINVRQTTSAAADTTIWALRNGASSTKTAQIESIQLNMAFDAATPITRTLLRWDFVRFSGATPTGGTSITAVALDSTSPSPQVDSIRFLNTGLTTSGISFGTAMLTMGCPATDSAIVNYQISDVRIVLNAGEGLCIRLNVAAVVGQSITGFITWSER